MSGKENVTKKSFLEALYELKNPMNDKPLVRSHTKDTIQWEVNPLQIAPWTDISKIKEDDKDQDQTIITFPTDDFGARPWTTKIDADVILSDKDLQNNLIRVKFNLLVVSPGKQGLGETVFMVPSNEEYPKGYKFIMKAGEENKDSFELKYNINKNVLDKVTDKKIVQDPNIVIKFVNMDKASGKIYMDSVQKYYLMYGLYPAIFSGFTNWLLELLNYVVMKILVPIPIASKPMSGGGCDDDDAMAGGCAGPHEEDVTKGAVKKYRLRK